MLSRVPPNVMEGRHVPVCGAWEVCIKLWHVQQLAATTGSKVAQQ